MRTDPKNHDYVCEHGASRNYEARRDMAHADTILRAQKQLESQKDAMAKLESKTYDSKKEMEVLDALEEVKQMNKRLQNFDHDQLIKEIQNEGIPENAESEQFLENTQIIKSLKQKRIIEGEGDSKTGVDEDDFDSEEISQIIKLDAKKDPSSDKIPEKKVEHTETQVGHKRNFQQT